MRNRKLERVLEYVVNGENELAAETLREHFIESAREIYNDLLEADNQSEEDAMDETDKSGDFEDDISSISDEVEAEENLNEEGENEIEFSMNDLEGEMEIEGEEGSEEEQEMEMALDNVNTSIEELRAAYNNLKDEALEDEEGMEETDPDNDFEGEFEAGEEGGDISFDEEEESKQLEEGATLKKEATPSNKDTGNKKSPVPQNNKSKNSNGAKPVPFAKNSSDKANKPGSPKNLGVKGPQDQGGKMNKKVSAPVNKPAKSKSLFSKKTTT